VNTFADAPPQLDTTRQEPFLLEQALLHHVHELIARGAVDEGMSELLPALKACRERCAPSEWLEVVKLCLRHPLRELLHEDPFTRHAYVKPRGYAGDAVLMDYIYSVDEGWPVPEGTSELGQKLFAWTTRSPACEGVRARREFIAGLLDRLAEQKERPHVLSVASGHLREVLLSASVKRRRLGRLLALDADRQTLAEVERCYGAYNIETVAASVREILTRGESFGSFDLVYSLGLFDYLSQGAGQRLAAGMFRLLRPGGRLLLANFLPGIPDWGYMESYMDWKLIYRTRQEMLDLIARIPQEETHEIRIFAEENQNIIFLEVTRRV